MRKLARKYRSIRTDLESVINGLQKGEMENNVQDLETINESCHYREFPDRCGVRVTVNYLDNIYEVMDYISFHSESYQLQERDNKLSVPNEDG